MSSKKSDGNKRDKVKVKQKYKGREFLPVTETKYAEADGRYYLAGRAIFDILTVPVRCSMPWTPRRGNPIYGIPVKARQELAMALRKIDPSEAGSSGGPVTIAEAKDWPNLIEHLTALQYPDGTKRQTSSMVVVSDGTGWRVCLSDKDNNRTMWKTGTSLQTAIEALELALMADDPGDWRKAADSYKGRKK